MEWRDVPGTAGVYEVSDTGQMRSNAGGKRRAPLKLSGRPRGYRRAHLTIDGVEVTRDVHIIVAAAFIGPCPPGHETHHIDRKTDNNRASNLNYLTKAEHLAEHRPTREKREPAMKIQQSGMTPADFKTAHESLGLPTSYIAERIGVTVGRVWAYEHPSRKADVPEHAAEVMRELTRLAEAAVDGEILAAERAGIVQRNIDLSAFYARHPDLDGWGALAQGLVLGEVQRRLQLPIEYVA